MGLKCKFESPPVVDFNAEKTAPSTTIPEDMVGKMVVVFHNDKPFVGQVLKVTDEKIKVSCMQK